MGTNTSPPLTPSPPPANPNLLLSPVHSPQPDDDDFGDGDGHGDGNISPQGDDDDAHNTPQEPDPWQDYNTDPDMHNDPDLYPSRPSPPDDNIGFAQLITRAAKYHGVKLHSDPQEEDFLLETFAQPQKSTHILPMLKGLIKHAPEVFKDPVRTRVL